MLKLQYNNTESQRRPSRISASVYGDRLATSDDTNRTSRMLKCSTITKVPPAKSRLKQPVAGLLVTMANTTNTADKQSPKPSRLARLSTTANRNRPSSLSLKNVAPTFKSATNSSSHLISSSTSRQNSSASILPQAKNQLVERTNSSKSSLSDRQQDITRTGAIQSKPPMQSTIKRKSHASGKQNTTGSPLISPGECRGLKNMAVVHPQHSLRAKSSATLTGHNKLSPTTTKLVSCSTTGHLAAGKNGKVSSQSHKDVANRRDITGVGENEAAISKQDGSQISGRHLQTSLSNNADASLNEISSGISLTSHSFVSLAVENEKTNDEQFAKSNNGNHLTSSQVNKASATTKAELSDEKQHENIKQSNKHHSPDSSNPTLMARVMDESDNKKRTNTNNNNCYFHERAPKSTLKSPATISLKRHDNSAQAINDRILPKPLGQQVLSLMMLDVGLLPSNNHLQQQQQQHQQEHQSSRFEESHVRIQGPILRHTLDGVVAGVQAPSFNDNSRSASFRAGKTLSANRLNGYSSLIDYNTNDEQCRNYHFLQPSHETLRLQVRFSSEDNENSRSVSLPCSPRIRVHKREGGHAINQGSDRLNAFGQETATNQSNTSGWQSTSCMAHTDFLTRKLSPVSSNQLPKLKNQNQSLSVCDSQDAHSLTSSSSSSLNHYPPLLALSNQLNGFKFDELVKGTVDRLTSRKQNISSVTKSENETILSSDQCNQVAKQHEILTNDLNYELENQSTEIDHLKECSRRIERMINPEEVCPNRLAQAEENRVQLKEQCCGNEFCADPQLRRQQQPRSHSISGQEYHLNGNYQRPKQLSYTRRSVLENYSQTNTQIQNRVHPALSPYQQYQPLGRSPSPLNVDSQTQYGSPLRDGSINYLQDRQPRKQLHSSLECLNTGYSDYQHQLQQQQYHHQQQIQNHNQHYAASYVLSPPPANTVINPSGDQDLAAAAMGAPPSQYHSFVSNSSNNSCHTGYQPSQTQTLINRAMNQVSQSPLRRAGYTSAQGAGASILNHLTNLHPMRAGHSSLSLASSSYMIEDKLQNEIKKLHSELKSEKEKNEALNSQLNINSSLMAAFEQSLTTLNTRLRQLTTLNEKKDNEIEELRAQLNSSKMSYVEDKKSPIEGNNNNEHTKAYSNSERDNNSENNLLKIIEELRRQLIEKDRLLTDTRLEALSAAHQLEQLESKLNGEQSMLANEDDLDEGVMVVNHSPSDSDAITDPAHFNDINSQMKRANQINNGDNLSFTLKDNKNMANGCSNENNNTDNQSNHSSDYSIEVKSKDQGSPENSISQQFNEDHSGGMDRMIDSLLLTN